PLERVEPRVDEERLLVRARRAARDEAERIERAERGRDELVATAARCGDGERHLDRLSLGRDNALAWLDRHAGRARKGDQRLTRIVAGDHAAANGERTTRGGARRDVQVEACARP